MKKSFFKILYVFVFALYASFAFSSEGTCFAAVNYENFAPAPFSNRMGIGDKVENRKSVQVKRGEVSVSNKTGISNTNKAGAGNGGVKKQGGTKTAGGVSGKTQGGAKLGAIEKGKTAAKTDKALTYADLSLKQISKDVIDEMDYESPEILSDLSILYNSAVQRSETIKYAIYKLSNPDGTKPDESAIKKILKPIASVSTIAGTALSANPYMASGALIGGGLMNAFSTGDKEANYKFTKVTDADMVLLVRKIDELQKNLLNNYINYRSQKELLKLSMENLENRRKIYNSIQSSNTASREQIIVADTYYRNAQSTVKKAQAEYNLSRVILENLAGKEALEEIEKRNK